MACCQRPLVSGTGITPALRPGAKKGIAVETRLTSSPEPGIFIPTTYTIFFMTTLTPSRCLLPMDVNCLIVLARRVFFSLARLTLRLVSHLSPTADVAHSSQSTG